MTMPNEFTITIEQQAALHHLGLDRMFRDSVGIVTHPSITFADRMMVGDHWRDLLETRQRHLIHEYTRYAAFLMEGTRAVIRYYNGSHNVAKRALQHLQDTGKNPTYHLAALKERRGTLREQIGELRGLLFTIEIAIRTEAHYLTAVTPLIHHLIEQCGGAPLIQVTTLITETLNEFVATHPPERSSGLKCGVSDTWVNKYVA